MEMNWSMVLFGVLPLIIFVVIDSFAGLKPGIVAAVFFAVVEVAYSLWAYRSIDYITIGSLALVLIFGGLSYYADNPIFFKLQPVIMGAILGIVILVMQVLKHPIMVVLAQKYHLMLPAVIRANLNHPLFLAELSRTSLYLGFAFLVHAGAVAYAAFFMSTWWWLALRGVGLYIFMGLAAVAGKFLR